MKRFLELLLLCITLSLPLGASQADESVDQLKGPVELFLQGYDALTTTDHKARIRAKVEIDSNFPFRPDLEGVEMGFFYRGKMIGKKTSDSEGMVHIRHHFKQRGTHRVEVRVLKGDYKDIDFLNRETVAKVFVWDKDMPIFISDIDHTISDNDIWSVIFGDIEDQKPFPKSSNVLHRVRGSYRVLYLTARDDAFFRLSRRWLSHHNFPEGPLFVWDLTLDQRVPWDHGEYKQEVIAELREKFNAIEVGVGDRPHDIEAYLEEGLKAYVLRSASNEDDEFDSRATQVRSWSELEKDLLD